MKNIAKKMDPQSRRSFVSGIAKSALGLGVLSVAKPDLVNAGTILNPGALTKDPEPGRAKSVIYLYMSGGMSHIDTFDPKPGAETQGPVEALDSTADDVQVSEYLPMMAKQMHNVAVVSSLNSTQGAHQQGRYFMHTAYTLRGTIRHPDMGAWAAYHLGKANESLPANVKIGGNSSGLGGGFLESKFAALPIGDPESGLQNSQLPNGVEESRFRRRMARLKRMNSSFTEKYDTKESRAFAAMYDEAVKLMKSDDLETFDLTKESDEVRDRYGRNKFGQGCLLARRMVEAGVRFIEVDNGGWDTHGDNFERVKEKGAVLDQALSALLEDLSNRGLLDSTLVVVATEFGRTPTIQTDRNMGRNHYPKAFSCLLAGGGIQGGIRYGLTDDEGREVIDMPVSVPDFNATIGYAMGIDMQKKVMSPSLRPFTFADKGEPVLELFSQLSKSGCGVSPQSRSPWFDSVQDVGREW
jgi:hypothetical protein